jgi:S1-C subfamily serine protease
MEDSLLTPPTLQPGPASAPAPAPNRSDRGSRTNVLGLVLAAVLGGGVSAAAVVAVDGSSNGPTQTVTVPGAAAPSNASALVSNPPQASGDTKSVAAIYREAGAGVVRIVQGQGQGSGFVISKDGYILTNAHVVDSTGPVYVSFSNADRTEARVIGKDPATDVALLKVDEPPASLSPVPLGTSSNLQVGDPVVAIGNPFGLDRTVTSGIVSALGRQITSPSDSAINGAIQTDAAINHGNSGGPLLNMRGEVIGINSQIADSGVNANVGVGFAIPIDLVKTIATDLKSSGAVKHAWLGVALSPVDAALAAKANLSVDKGAMLGSVQDGSPAQQAGLHGATSQVTIDGEQYSVGGDIVTAIDGAPITTMTELQNAIQAKRAGDAVTLSVIHADGSKAAVKVTLGTKPATAQQQAPADPSTPAVPGFPLP